MPGIDECLLEAMSLPGARGAWLVDWTSGLALGAAGESPVGDHETTAAEAAELARAAAEYDSFAGIAAPTTAVVLAARANASPVPGTGATGVPAAAGTAASAPATRQRTETVSADGGLTKGPPVEDLIVSTRSGYHVLRFVDTAFDSSVFLHLWLDRDTGNLALARLRLRDLAERLVLG
ncbi:hypothetical protein ACFUJR_36885 [Streptomyces sp. NPDC057271]|uniref:hypothetical protein n=1 Tax=unclassified Streptomyces TaxID=2593676 RepID=UPI0036290440